MPLDDKVKISTFDQSSQQRCIMAMEQSDANPIADRGIKITLYPDVSGCSTPGFQEIPVPIVVAEHPDNRGFKAGKSGYHEGCDEISGMEIEVPRRFVQNVNVLPQSGQVIVRVTENADYHNYLLLYPVREFPEKKCSGTRPSSRQSSLLYRLSGDRRQVTAVSLLSPVIPGSPDHTAGV
jgi:hypothetical protein